MHSKVIFPPIQTGAGAWIGSDLAKRESEWLEYLSPADIAELERAAEPLITDSFNIGVMDSSTICFAELEPQIGSIMQ